MWSTYIASPLLRKYFTINEKWNEEFSTFQTNKKWTLSLLKRAAKTFFVSFRASYMNVNFMWINNLRIELILTQAVGSEMKRMLVPIFIGRVLLSRESCIKKWKTCCIFCLNGKENKKISSTKAQESWKKFQKSFIVSKWYVFSF